MVNIQNNNHLSFINNHLQGTGLFYLCEIRATSDEIRGLWPPGDCLLASRRGC